MDKLLNSRWFVRIIALFLALMFYVAVNIDSNANEARGNRSLDGTVLSEALSNVPLHAYYDEEQFAILNLPKEVTVYLEGPTTAITQAKISEGYEVYVDLSDLGIGEHRVKVEHRDFPERLNVSIEPSTINVIIQEKVTQTMPVDIEYLNRDQITEGYSAEEAIVLPNNVKITGAKSEVERIGFVKGFVDLKDAKDTLEENVPLKVYDQFGEILDLAIEPSVVEVKVPIIAPNKTVPIIIERVGKLPDGLSIQSFEATPNEVTIYGPEEIVNNIDYIDQIQIDLSKIKEDTVQQIELPVPKGLTNINPKTVEVKIDIEPESHKRLTNLPIKVIGLSDSNEVSFQSPNLGVVNLDVFGAQNVLKELNRSDFHVVLNVSELNTGKHTVDLEVFGPQDVRWELETKKATFELKRK